MQTFLPYADFNKTVKCLDWKRLGKQRVEAKQILNILCDRTTTKGWRHHPAVLQWRGYEDALKKYFNECVLEWIARGYNNTMQLENETLFEYPHWFGDDKFHSSHRSALLNKYPEWYKQFGWKESYNNGTYQYYWPVTKETQTLQLINQ